jgi:hypothetical protein
MDWAKQRFYEFDPVYNKKTYAYGNEEKITDPIKPITHLTNDPF